MFLLYMLLREIPTDTRDPDTKDRHFGFFLHVSSEVVKSAVEMIIAAITVDIIVGDFFPSCSLSPAKDALAEYMLGVFLTTIPCICVLITTLIHTGFLIEE
jgi:hypothetical protein